MFGSQTLWDLGRHISTSSFLKDVPVGVFLAPSSSGLLGQT